MTTAPRFSVVIPAYDAERWLGDAVRSVLAQTVQPVEVVVVDDGSRDGTAEVARSFGGRVRLLQQANAGVSAARNAGTAATSGSHVAFLDADDLWTPLKLARQADLLRQQPQVALAYTGLQIVDAHLVPTGPPLAAPRAEEALRNTLLLRPPVISVAQTAVLPRPVLDAVGGFDEALSTSADTDLACRVAARWPVAGVDEPLVLYRQHDAQMHADVTAMERDMRRVHDKLFGDPDLPPQVRDLESPARAALALSLAIDHARGRRTRRAVAAVTEGVRHDPVLVARRVAELTRGRLSRRR